MEEVLVTAIVFGSVLAMIKMWLDYRGTKLQAKASAGADPSLTTSELKALVAEAVEGIIDDRVTRLERRLEERDRPRLQPASESKPLDTELEHPAPPLVRRDRDITQ